MNAEQMLMEEITIQVENPDLMITTRERAEVLAKSIVETFKQRVNQELDQLDGKFAGFIWRRRDGKVEEQFVVFVPRDFLLYDLLDVYAEMCQKEGCGNEQVDSAERLRSRVGEWQDKHGTKLPDCEPGETP